MVDERLERIMNSSEEVTYVLFFWQISVMDFALQIYPAVLPNFSGAS